MTRKENHAHKWLHGTQQVGERNGFSKLTERKVRAIRDLRQKGVSLSVLARRFGVNQSAISDISRRRTWRHVG